MPEATAIGIFHRDEERTIAKTDWGILILGSIRENAYVERLSVRRECVDHVVVFGERHLPHLLLSYKTYYNETRTHLSLSKDAPLPRTVQPTGPIFSVPILGGLHHQYGRM